MEEAKKVAAGIYVLAHMQASSGSIKAEIERRLKLFAAEAASPAAGWRLVPPEITLEMQHAYFDVIDANLRRVQTDYAFGRYSSNQQAYRAMIAAAPVPSPSEEARAG